MSEMSPAEAEVVARFDAAEPAPESWRGDDGLVVVSWRDCDCGWSTKTCDELHTLSVAVRRGDLRVLPELRAKAAAADRVRELCADAIDRAYASDADVLVSDVMHALDGPSPC